MFDTLVSGGDYAAIGALCFTAWLAGRRTATSAPRENGDPPPLPAMQHRLSEVPVMPPAQSRALPDNAAQASTTSLKDWSARELEQAAAEQFDSCEPALILTRKNDDKEPLPARLDDPLTPQVMARYQLVAGECSGRETPILSR